MKKIITLIILSLTFLIVGCKANAEDLIDRILKTEVVEGKETVRQRIDSLGHMALLKNEIVDIGLYTKSVNEETNEKFVDYILKIGNYEMRMNQDVHNTLYAVLDINALKETSHFEGSTIVNTSDTKLEIVEVDFDTVLRVTYDSSDEYVVVDIPFVEFGDKTVMVNPAKALITVGRGDRKESFSMEEPEAQGLYYLTKSLEALDYYEYELVECASNPPIDGLPRVTDPRVLNQGISVDVAFYDNKRLENLSDEFSVRYSSFDKNDKRFGEKYVYFLFFLKDGYTYRVSCSREGILDLNVYAGSGRFRYYTIPTLEKPYEIYEDSLKTGELTMLDFNELTELDIEQVENIKEIVEIIRTMSDKTGINIGI